MEDTTRRKPRSALGGDVPDGVSVRRRVGDAGDARDAGLHHQLGAIVELHPHLSTRQLETPHTHTHTHTRQPSEPRPHLQLE